MDYDVHANLNLQERTSYLTHIQLKLKK